MFTYTYDGYNIVVRQINTASPLLRGGLAFDKNELPTFDMKSIHDRIVSVNTNV